MVIGIPRAQNYYIYFPLWKTLFTRLGHSVRISGATNREVVLRGIAAVSDDKCLPFKTALGHVANLKGECDAVFIPRIAESSHALFCPNTIYFPDMVQVLFSQSFRLLTSNIDMRTERKMFESHRRLSKAICGNSRLIGSACREAMEVYTAFRRLASDGAAPDRLLEHITREDDFDGFGNTAQASKNGNVRIMLAGHDYYLWDRYISLDIAEKLTQAGVELKLSNGTCGHFSAVEAWGDDVRWLHSRQILDAALHYLRNRHIDGIINIAFFNCTIQAANIKFIEHINSGQHSVPLMNLIMDEHTSETGLVTRIEAFLETVKNVKRVRRKS